MDKLFTFPDIWTGGDIELALELGPPLNSRLIKVMRGIYEHPGFDGLFLDNEQEPSDQAKLKPHSDLIGAEGVLLFYGVLTLSPTQQVPCRLYVTRLETGNDWISIGIPMAGLATVYEVGAYPFDDGSSLEWRAIVYEWLRNFGEELFQDGPFLLGLIGWDITAEVDIKQIEEAGVPIERWFGYLVPRENQLVWFAPNQGAPFTIHAT